MNSETRNMSINDMFKDKYNKEENCNGKNNCVVILNYNDYESCIELVNKVRNYKCISKIIVVDNCSTDNSFQMLKISCESEKVVIIKTKFNGGYAYGNQFGCNYAVNNCNADFITIMNPDIYVKEETLNAILGSYENCIDPGVIGCMMKCYSRINLPSAWKLPGYVECILENLILAKKIFGNKTFYPESYFSDCNKVIVKVDAVAGSFFVISKKAFESIGGFDVNTFLYYEENILAYKLKSKGFNNFVLTNEKFDHYHSVSINKSYKKIGSRLDLAFESRKYYAEHYLGCGAFKMFILKVTYRIGKFNYIIANQIRQLYTNR